MALGLGCTFSVRGELLRINFGLVLTELNFGLVSG